MMEGNTRKGVGRGRERGAHYPSRQTRANDPIKSRKEEWCRMAREREREKYQCKDILEEVNIHRKRDV